MTTPDARVTITDVTLREYGQNVPGSHLHVFNPEIRAEIALKLIDAGFTNLEVLSCINPRLAPAMNGEAIKKITSDLGRIDGVHIITLVPNKAGYRNFLQFGLGPDGYNHTMGIFFSAVEAHNPHKGLGSQEHGVDMPKEGKTCHDPHHVNKDHGRKGDVA